MIYLIGFLCVLFGFALGFVMGVGVFEKDRRSRSHLHELRRNSMQDRVRTKSSVGVEIFNESSKVTNGYSGRRGRPRR